MLPIGNDCIFFLWKTVKIILISGHRNSQAMIEITQTEKAILDSLLDGFSVKQIADMFHLSVSSIYRYKYQISCKIKQYLGRTDSFKGRDSCTIFYYKNQNLFKMKPYKSRHDKRIRIHWAIIDREFQLKAIRQDYSFIGVSDYLG